MLAEKAAARRGVNPFYMKEPAIDVCSGAVNIGAHYGIKMDCYDRYINPNHDATYCKEIADNFYYTVHSSHGLEHILDYRTALKNWIRISNKYILITVPDEEMYEHFIWPSIFNNDHKVSFTISEKRLPMSVNVYEMLDEVKDLVKVLWVKRIEEGFRPGCTHDQTANSEAECVIEILLEKI